MLAVLHTYLLNYNTPPGFLSVPIPSVLFFFSCLTLSLYPKTRYHERRLTGMLRGIRDKPTLHSYIPLSLRY